MGLFDMFRSKPAPTPVVTRPVQPPPPVASTPPAPLGASFKPVAPEAFFGNTAFVGRKPWGHLAYQANRNVERALNGGRIEDWVLMTNASQTIDRYEAMPGQDIGWSGDVGVKPPKDRNQQCGLVDLAWEVPHCMSMDVQQGYPGRSRAAWLSFLDVHEAWTAPDKQSLPVVSLAINRAPELPGGDGKIMAFIYETDESPHVTFNPPWESGRIAFDPTARLHFDLEFMFSRSLAGYCRVWLNDVLFCNYSGRLGARKPAGSGAAHINEGIYQEDAPDPFGLFIGNRRLVKARTMPDRSARAPWNI